MDNFNSNLNQKQKIYLGVGVASVAAILLGYLFYKKSSTEEQTKPKETKEEVVASKKVEVDLKEEERHAEATKLKEEGNKAFKAQEFDKAIKLYGEALALTNRDAHFLYSNRSAAHLAANNYSEAVNDAKRAIQIAPNWSKGYFRLGKALLQERNLNEAHLTLKKGLLLDPTSEEIKVVMAKVKQEFPIFGELDSRYIVETNISKEYFTKGSKTIAETLSLDYNTVVENVKNALQTEDNILDLPIIKPAFQSQPVLVLRILMTVLINQDNYLLAQKFGEKALSFKPNDPDILAFLLFIHTKSNNTANETLSLARRAIKFNPTDILCANSFGHIVMQTHIKISNNPFPQPIREILAEFDQALKIPGVNKMLLVESGLQTWFKLFQDPEISQELQQEEATNIRNNTPHVEAYLNGLLRGAFNKLCMNNFFISALSEVAFTQPALDKVLSPFRMSLVTLKPGPDFQTLQRLVYAFGLQSWRNGYAWPLLEEDNDLLQVRKKLENMLKPDTQDVEEGTTTITADGRVSPKILHYASLLAMYEPLWKVNNLYPLISKCDLTKLDPLLARLLKLSLLDHFTEEEIKKNLVTLTPIAESPIVRFYNNYVNVTPVWDNFPYTATRISPKTEMEWLFPYHQLKGFNTDETTKILVVGCGSGMEPLQMPIVYENVDVTALDISSSQLAFAIRCTKEFGHEDKIKYYLADLMQLKSDLLPVFDFIVAHNVLHHLPDLLKGWERLLPFLRPGGIMKISLFPKRWHKAIYSARKLLISKFTSPLFEQARDQSQLPLLIRQPTLEELRLARNYILEAQDEEMEDIISNPSFANLNEFQDMIFNPQMWAITFQNIGQCLTKLGLNLVGFEFPGITQESILNYRFEHPDDPHLKNYAYLDKFEEENPHSLNIYSNLVFTCEKPV